MAVGFSGSNGGISKKNIGANNMAIGFSGSSGGIEAVGRYKKGGIDDLPNLPDYVDYFVNNRCNLDCKHCYVQYSEYKNELTLREWTKTFDKLIELGALTFGNVGREPLLSPKKTLALLEYFTKKKKEIPRLRFGLVTNGTLLKERLAKRITETSPDYIDISIDGLKKEHDFTRGKGSYTRTITNIKNLPEEILSKVFVLFTLMNHNKESIKELAENISGLGLNRLLISPYIKTTKDRTGLGLETEAVAEIYRKIACEDAIDFKKLNPNFEILLKSDYDLQKDLVNALVEKGTVDRKNLLIDDYKVLFNKYPKNNGSAVLVNYIPYSETFSRAIRISHNGYVGGCIEMCFSDYTKRAKGNIRETPIEEILRQNSVQANR